jgi:hypothetical protein
MKPLNVKVSPKHGYIEYIPEEMSTSEWDYVLYAMEMRWRLSASDPCWHPDAVHPTRVASTL